jgi:hypothetical protein
LVGDRAGPGPGSQDVTRGSVPGNTVRVTTIDFESSMEDTRHRDKADSGGASSLFGAEELALTL